MLFSPKQAIHIQLHRHSLIMNAGGEAVSRNHGEVDAASCAVYIEFYPNR